MLWSCVYTYEAVATTYLVLWVDTGWASEDDHSMVDDHIWDYHSTAAGASGIHQSVADQVEVDKDPSWSMI